ncbi:MAG: hypothetical protein M3Z00_05400, partial [Actinomycetota bacterium]|nr:hypothetical protein [Actinomycetota bacterium]
GGTATTTSEPATPDCTDPIGVSGIDVTKVARPGHNSTHRWGLVSVSGRWDGRALQVTSQRPATATELESADDTLPTAIGCSPPAGGWKLGATQDLVDIDKVERAVGPDVGQLAIGYPYGTGNVGPSNDLSHTAQVLVVGTIGEIDRARAAIRAVFTGNLCVVHADRSTSEITHQSMLLRAAFGNHWQALHLMSFGDHTVRLGDANNEVNVAYETQALRDVLAKVPGPTITVNAWLHPVG